MSEGCSGWEVRGQEGLLGNSHGPGLGQAPQQSSSLPSMPHLLPAGNRGFIDIMDMPNTNKYSFDG